jgi:hypothetical protein
MKSRFGAHLRVNAEFLKKGMLDGPTDDMTNTLEPFTHEPCRIIERTLIIARPNRNRDEPCFNMLLPTPSEFLSESDIPIITKCLKTLLALATRDE